MKVLLFGSGNMGREYLKVLKALQCDVIVVGRNEEKAKSIAQEFGYVGLGGGVEALRKINTKGISCVINTVSIENLFSVSEACLKAGLINILIEKPGALNLSQLQDLKKNIKDEHSLHIAFNRRYYNSVLSLEKYIQKDGHIVGCLFDFTDREKDVISETNAPSVVRRWGWANATHVIDLAFFMIGLPNELHALRSGGFPGHPEGATFTGCGQSPKSLFSYFATWSGGGRWNVEISTPAGRYKISPLEELSFCRKNQFSWEKILFNDDDDTTFKPGLMKMVKAKIIDKDYKRLPDIDDQMNLCRVVNRIFGYEK